jgi:hypothetical protein
LPIRGLAGRVGWVVPLKRPHRLYGQQDQFLALLAEVWLHWDPDVGGMRDTDKHHA